MSWVVIAGVFVGGLLAGAVLTVIGAVVWLCKPTSAPELQVYEVEDVEEGGR